MQITVTGRHFTVDDELRRSVEGKLLAILENKALKISSATAVLDREGSNRFRADLMVRCKQHEAEAKSEGYDLYKVIDEALGKIDVQLGRLVDKRQDRHGAPLREVLASEEAAE